MYKYILNACFLVPAIKREKKKRKKKMIKKITISENKRRKMDRFLNVPFNFHERSLDVFIALTTADV